MSFSAPARIGPRIQEGRLGLVNGLETLPTACLPLLASGAISARHECLFSCWCPLAGAPGRWVRTGRRNDEERKEGGETSLGLGPAVGPARH